jgi:hypothetical protein
MGMDLLVALSVTVAANLAVWLFLQRRYEPELFRVVALTFLGTVALRHLLAIYLWLHHTDSAFSRMFWGDSETYDAFGAAVANAWKSQLPSSFGGGDLPGKVNRGFIYFVASIYYVFGHNALLVQFLNGIIGALISVVILEIGLLLYDRRVATRAMLLTAFFPQMIFWSSALYKDSAVMLCIALNILATLRLRESFRPAALGLYLATAAALLLLRFYIFYTLMAATLLSFLLIRHRRLLLCLVSYMVLVVSLIVLMLWTPLGTEATSGARYLDLAQLRNSRMDLARAGSGFAVEADVTTFEGAIKLLPVGVACLLFAPFPWMVANLRQMLVLPDVLLWYALAPALLRGLLASVRERLGQTLPILVFTATLTVAYGLFLGNVGTAYRQRTQIMMFCFLFIAHGMKQKEKPEGDSVDPVVQDPDLWLMVTPLLHGGGRALFAGRGRLPLNPPRFRAHFPPL